jgi:beta-mannosidase
MENVEIEAEENVKRLRHHPCIAIWCGNNELEQGLVGEKWAGMQMSWSDYGKLFDKLLKNIVKKNSPEIPYWPGSPHTPKGDRKDFNSPKSGDAHLWFVWHRREPFEWYRTSEPRRFVSEFGFQSFPEPKTVNGYTLESDRNLTSWVMDHHQRSPIGNSAIMSYMLDWFRMPKDFESALWMTQILQGMAIKFAVDTWRKAPQCMGAIYWQLNDCWPVASWSSIDYHGRWKALQYMAKRFFEPLHLSIEEDWKNASAEIFISNDLMETAECKVNWILMDLQGNALKEGSKKCKASSGKTIKITSLKFDKEAKDLHLRNLLLWAEIVCDGKTVSSAMSPFYKPKSVELEKPSLKAKIKACEGNKFIAEISAEKPALWAWLELKDADTVFSDNFFHVRPGKNLSISFEPSEKMNLKEVEKRLIIRSLKDLY